MNIYSILSSKPHNTHHLNRYINFIESCKQQTLQEGTYVEKHHICPKADDMFPEYINFKEHSWNKVLLTGRQHFIAHMILWKAYPKISSQCFAFYAMSCVKNKKQKINSKMFETLRINASSIISKNSRNSVVVKDSISGACFRISKTDYRYINKELLHMMHDKVLVYNTKTNKYESAIKSNIEVKEKLIDGTYVYGILLAEQGRKNKESGFMRKISLERSYESRLISGRKSAETCRRLKVNAFFDPALRFKICSMGGKVQGPRNKDSGFLKKIATEYWDRVRSGVTIRINKRKYDYYHSLNTWEEFKLLIGTEPPADYLVGKLPKIDMKNSIWIHNNLTKENLRRPNFFIIPEGWLIGRNKWSKKL